MIQHSLLLKDYDELNKIKFEKEVKIKNLKLELKKENETEQPIVEMKKVLRETISPFE